jgi:cytosine/adenosine deaminase-related metal-dependent hydrolase
MAGLVPAGDSFTDWLRRMVRIKTSWTREQFLESWRAGSEMSLRSGITSVGDTLSEHSLLEEVWDDAPVRITPFLELTGLIGDSTADQLLEATMRTIDHLCPGSDEIGLSPHSLYSTATGLNRALAREAANESLSTTMHLAESDEEFDMFQNGRGELFDWLKSLGRDMGDCGGMSPVQLAEEQGLLNPSFLAVHVNRLAPGDAAILCRHLCRVVHCPGSHAFFSHAPFPYHELVKAGVKVALGTDSLASMDPRDGDGPRLSMLDEMQRFAKSFPDVSPEEIVRMGTVNGAYALGAGRAAGELNRQACADFVTLPHDGSLADAWETVVHSGGMPEKVMVAGKWA